MLRGGGMLYITILSLLAPLASAGVKGFGIIFSVEPMKGSTGGGTELHIAGAGFAYVTQVLVGGKPCHILEQMTKDGELTAFTPALAQGKYDVEVVFTSGHRAKLRNGQFQTHSRYTPVVNTISQAASVISNVTWRGDLKKTLEVGMNEIFRDTGEKRNATEIMHAYLGTGIEILSDKAGRDEFRCDILETPTETEGVCEVSAGTPAGYYNFTYVLQDGVSMNGYGKSVWEVQGLPYVSMDGQEYAIEVTWKHPFYDYFRQLRDFCRQASSQEVMQVRCNRLLWSYEATRIEAEHDHDPLISPSYVARMAEIFGFDVKTQGCVVRNCKAQLKAFAKAYRSKQDIDVALIDACYEMLQRDVAKYSEMVTHWSSEVKDDVKFDLNKLAAGEMFCVNCKIVALSFCLECKDYLCLKCYAELHGKGSRKDHAPFCLVPCALCVQLPAKIHCTFTDKSLCHKCYALSHIKMLPLDGKENQPRRINYVEQYNRYAEFAKARVKKIAVQPEDIPALDDAAYESVLSTDWHPFYDARGVKYYHNFAAGERMRQSPRRVPAMEDAGAEEKEVTMDVTKIVETTNELLENEYREAKPLEVHLPSKSGGASSGLERGQVPLSGFDALKSDVPAAVRAAEDPEHRLLRPPHRTHLPNELPEDEQ